MRSLSGKDGAVFDIDEKQVPEVMDILKKVKDSGRRQDFEMLKCTEIPELLDADRRMQQQDRNFGGGSRGGYGSRGGGTGGRGGMRNGGGSYGSQRNQDASVFVGNLSYSCDQNQLQRMFAS